MARSDAVDRVLAEMRHRVGDDADDEAIREAADETAVAAVLGRLDDAESGGSLRRRGVDYLVGAYRAEVADAADATPTDTGTPDAEDADPVGRGTPPQSEVHRVDRVSHFRDTVRTAAEWAEANDWIGPGVFEVASDARTTDGLDAQLEANFDDADYEIQSYTLGPDERHPSWTKIALSEPYDPARLPSDVTIREIVDQP